MFTFLVIKDFLVIVKFILIYNNFVNNFFDELKVGT